MYRSMLRRLVFAAIVAAASGCTAGAGRQLISTGISSYDRQTILDAHNQLRQSVALGRVPGQPGAANMMQMVWDDELAAKAQQWADTCGHGHDPGRHVGRFRVGQNIARSWTWPRPDSLGATSEFTRQIQNWFNEVSGYRYNGHSASGTGHYSQLIWGDSYLVGCGYSYFLDPHQGYTKLYVCNYGPGGNIRGYSPYQSGSPSCESYGTSPSNEYSGLCYPPGRYGTSSVEQYGTSSADQYGTSSVGQFSTSSVRQYGTSSVGHYSTGTPTVRQYSTTSAVQYSTPTPAHFDTSALGNYGTSSLGHYGTNSLRQYSATSLGRFGSTSLHQYDTTSLGRFGSSSLGYYDSNGVYYKK